MQDWEEAARPRPGGQAEASQGFVRVHEMRAAGGGAELVREGGAGVEVSTLEGWRLYHDFNYESRTATEGFDNLFVEGNKHR